MGLSDDHLKASTPRRALSVLEISGHKAGGGRSPLVATTSYDYTTARMVDGQVDLVLVGDSLGMVIQGHQDTLAVTLEQMIYHGQCVRRGLGQTHVVVDMPFLTYQLDVEKAVQNAGKVMVETRAHAVKLEGGVEISAQIKKMVEVGIPVMGHVGMTPQRVHQYGGFRVQGKDPTSRAQILKDALAVQEAGAYCLVLEAIPSDLAGEVTAQLSIPTIGIGAGRHCDGQILVIQDLLGMNCDFKPKFVKHFLSMDKLVKKALRSYSSEVRGGTFPSAETSFTPQSNPTADLESPL